jgi:hypothetical protein
MVPSDFAACAELLQQPWKKDLMVLKNLGAAGCQVHFHINLIVLDKEFFPFASELQMHMSNPKTAMGLDALRYIGGSPFFLPRHFVARLNHVHSSKREFAAEIEGKYEEALHALDLLQPVGMSGGVRTLHIVNKMSALGAGLEDEFMDVPVQSSVKAHQLMLFRSAIVVVGLKDTAKYGVPFDLPINSGLALVGHLAWGKPLQPGEVPTKLQYNLMNQTPLADILLEAYEPS